MRVSFRFRCSSHPVVSAALLAFLALPRDARYLMPYSPLLSRLLVAALDDLAAALAARRPRLFSGRSKSSSEASFQLDLAWRRR